VVHGYIWCFFIVVGGSFLQLCWRSVCVVV
jgi:hypothetical protein